MQIEEEKFNMYGIRHIRETSPISLNRNNAPAGGINGIKNARKRSQVINGMFCESPNITSSAGLIKLSQIKPRENI